MTATVAVLCVCADAVFLGEKSRTELLESSVRTETESQKKRDLQQNELQRADGDVIDCADAELAVEALCAQTLHIGDDVRPQVDHIIARKLIPLLHAKH
jgi:hypothetical protein